MHVLYMVSPPDRHTLGGASALRSLGHLVTEAAPVSPPDASKLAEADSVVVATDGAAGTDLCREIRRRTAVPLLVLASRRDEVDIITELAVGADDVVIAPVSAREIDARLRAIIRRMRAADSACTLRCSTHETPDPAPVIEVGELRIDVRLRAVTRDGAPIPLTATEFRLLLALAEHVGAPQSRESLLERAWGHGYHGKSRIVDNAVQRLRGKVDSPSRRHVHSVRGYGYVLR